MGVEHVNVVATGSSPGSRRVRLGLSPIEKAKLKAAYFTFPSTIAGGDFVLIAALSEDLRRVSVPVVATIGMRGAFALVQFVQDEAAVGVTKAWYTFKYDLWDYEVYQDIVYLKSVFSGAERMDLYYEKMPIEKLEKAVQLRQLERHFTVA